MQTNNQILVGQFQRELARKLMIHFETVFVETDLSYPIHVDLTKTTADIKHPVCEENNYWVICHKSELPNVKKFIKKYESQI